MDEDARLAMLRSKFVLDTAPDVTLDALMVMCAEIFHVPVALVSLVDQHRQWFKAKHNFEANATGRAESFCAWTMLCDDRKVLVVRDATTDAMFKDNPLVTDGPKIRFYAGAPLVVDDVVFGSICLIDYEKHDAPAFFDEAAAARLRAIARVVSSHLQKPSYKKWLGAAVDTVREGVLLLEHSLVGVFGDRDGDGARSTPANDDDGATQTQTQTQTQTEPRRSTERVVFANTAAKRMLRSRFSRRAATESSLNTGRIQAEADVGCDLIAAFPGPPETLAKLKRVSKILADDASRRRVRRANALTGCDDTQPRIDLARYPSFQTLASFESTALDAPRGADGAQDHEEEEWEERWMNRGVAVVPTLEIDADFRDSRRRIELSFTNVPMDAIGCPATLVHARDVTETHEAKRALIRAKAAADAAVAAKSSFLANTSHEIRTPLNAIIAGSELLGDITSGFSGDQIELIDMVTRAGKSLLSIVNDVLDFSKLEADKLTLDVAPFVLENCIDLSFEMQGIKANAKSLVFTYSIDDSVPWTLVGDAARLRQVVTNLISNAVKFTPTNGSVVLRVRALLDGETLGDALYGYGADASFTLKRGRTSDLECHDDDVRLTKSKKATESHGEYDVPEDSCAAPNVDDGSRENTTRLLFEIIDNGIGLSERDRALLFTEFEQVNKKRTRQEGGTGLGLAISMRIVRLMGGDMTVTSDGRGKGSRFAFCVTLGRPDDAAEREAQCLGKKASFEGRKRVESQFAPSSGCLRGRRIDVISTCESFHVSAHSFIQSLGLEANFLTAAAVAALVEEKNRNPKGNDDPVAFLVDREFIPRAALGDALRQGLESHANAHEAGSRFLDACDEFIGSLSAALERSKADATSSPPDVLVMTFHAVEGGLTPGARICPKPLVHGKFRRWVADLALRHSGDESNVSANERWDAIHVRRMDSAGSEFVGTDSCFRGALDQTPASCHNGYGSLGQRRRSWVNLSLSLPRDDATEIADLDPDLKKRVRVLLAEDNVVNQKVATMMLRSMGFFVTVASDGEKAVSEFHAAAANGEPFDVVLMDLQMPLMDGLEAARAIVGAGGEANGNGNAIQGRAPAVAVAAPRIVALTADVAASVIQECRAAGMHGFLGTFFCFCFQDSDYFAGLSEYCLRILCHKT